ncbi:hypothetical protein A2368_04575 [Candidatus Collierbacteria bacterium RIFOXYB1_FULL_49_13]|uniref:Uncharacterized protein n=1 Tax=Candidatus Collierbacteria bacterium RIFOXYB1_FULL_49_13 TaxID=1817728 RepID=A0A1F5FF13_9BACT|nr:MAG: hypothetical protein A2368_04575 [Candidatus Collierbacteria bacterium RIFOXYB1_FULL_49_13]
MFLKFRQIYALVLWLAGLLCMLIAMFGEASESTSPALLQVRVPALVILGVVVGPIFIVQAWFKEKVIQWLLLVGTIAGSLYVVISFVYSSELIAYDYAGMTLRLHYYYALVTATLAADLYLSRYRHWLYNSHSPYEKSKRMDRKRKEAWVYPDENQYFPIPLPPGPEDFE